MPRYEDELLRALPRHRDGRRAADIVAMGVELCAVQGGWGGDVGSCEVKTDP